jgi:hypothetical protein
MPSISLDPTTSEDVQARGTGNADLGVGLLLLTLTARLGRIVDRTRLLATERRTANPEDRCALDISSPSSAAGSLVRLAVALSAVRGDDGLLITFCFSDFSQVNSSAASCSSLPPFSASWRCSSSS